MAALLPSMRIRFSNATERIGRRRRRSGLRRFFRGSARSRLSDRFPPRFTLLFLESFFAKLPLRRERAAINHPECFILLLCQGDSLESRISYLSLTRLLSASPAAGRIRTGT